MKRHNDVEPAPWNYGAIEVAWLEQAAHFTPAPASEPRTMMLVLAEGGALAISVEESGSLYQKQHTELEPGAGWLWDGGASLTLTPRSPGRALLALLPAATLTARLGSITDLTGRRLSAAQGGGAICAHMLAAFASQAPLLSAEQRQALGDGALDAIIVWLRSEQTLGGRLSTHRRKLLTAICAYIERCLDDDQLTPQSIADRFGISVRYLHTLFASTGITVARWITIRRLEAIRSELLRHGGDRGSIRDIATRWGFHDLPHFSRVFRQHFGEPPSVYVRRRIRTNRSGL